MKTTAIILTAVAVSLQASAYTFEPIKYGDMNSWVTRMIKESGVIGGNTKHLYEIGPTTNIPGNKPYSPLGGSPWATSNVYAKVAGVSKGSNAVYPATRAGSNKCAKLTTKMESVKVLGLINMDVMVAGSLFLGRIIEPISSTKNPYAKMDMGMPYTKRPEALIFDYKVDMPDTDSRVKSSGFGSKKTLPGHDHAVVYVMLQRRWEDENGNLHARRVASGSQLFGNTTGWKLHHALPLVYGNASTHAGYNASLLGLRDGARAFYAHNSKGKLVPVHEEGWDTDNAVPTHAIVMFSSGSGEPYVGTEGLTFYVDNIGFGF